MCNAFFLVCNYLRGTSLTFNNKTSRHEYISIDINGKKAVF